MPVPEADYGETHLGTNVVRRLLLMGYRGLVCVRWGARLNRPTFCVPLPKIAQPIVVIYVGYVVVHPCCIYSQKIAYLTRFPNKRSQVSKPSIRNATSSSGRFGLPPDPMPLEESQKY